MNAITMKFNKPIFVICLVLLAIYAISTLSDKYINQSKVIQTQAVVFENTCTQTYRRRRRNCFVKYVYRFSLSEALEYNTKDKLERRLQARRVSRNFSQAEIDNFLPKEYDHTIFLGIFSTSNRHNRSLKVGDSLLIEYRKDRPWKSKRSL